MEEKAFFDELDLLLKDIPSKDKEKIISAWKEKWASIQSEKEAESFLTPQEIAQQYFALRNEEVGKPTTCEFHQSLQVDETTTGDNEKDNSETTQSLEQNNNIVQEVKQEDKQDVEEKKSKKRNPFILILTMPLWILFLGLFLLVALLFTVGYGAFFLGVITALLYALFVLVCAVFQGINAQLFAALFQGGIAILLMVVAILTVAGMNAFIKVLWKGFKQATHFVFIGGKCK